MSGAVVEAMVWDYRCQGHNGTVINAPKYTPIKTCTQICRHVILQMLLG